MWKNLANLFKTTSSFLSSKKVPPGTPIDLHEQMKRQNHFASKKFFIAFTSFLGVLFFYFVSVAVLFFIPTQNDIIAGYVQIFTKTIEVIAIIVAAYLGVQTVADFQYSSSSSTNLETKLTATDKIIEEETTKYAEIYAEDISYAPYGWIMSFEEEKL
jgi:hypothetical protein